MVSDERLLDLRRVATIETEGSLPPLSRPLQPIDDELSLVESTPGRVVFNARLGAPGLAVFNDLHFPGGKAEVRIASAQKPLPLEIYRTNRVMRGVFLPAGNSQVVFTYRPQKLLAGATISGIGWLLISAFFGMLAVSRLRRSRELTLREFV